MSDLKVNVLVRCSKKTGKIDTVLTGLGTGLMRMWALNNTTPSKMTFIIDRESGKIVFGCSGKKDSLPTVAKEEKLGTCEDLGLSYEMLQEIGFDDRF